MKSKKTIQNSLLYRHRYAVAIFLLITLATFMAFYKFWLVPDGLNNIEMSSAVVSYNLFHGDFFESGLTNLPWGVVEWSAFKIFGVSPVTLRLPAIILTLTFVGLATFLLSKLFRPNLAMMGGLLLVSSAFTIAVARSASPVAMAMLLSVVVLIIGYYLINYSDRHLLGKFFGLIVVSVLLSYMVAGPYIVLMLFAASLLHPKVRLLIKRHIRLAIFMLFMYLLLVSPIILAVILSVMNQSVFASIREILLIEPLKLSNLDRFINNYCGFSPAVASGIVVPLVTVVSLIMSVIGLVYNIVKARFSVRFCVICLPIPIIFLLGLINPDIVYLLYLPTVILQVCCLDLITSKWYGLFPNNPYARVFAILPITILIGSLCAVDASRFFSAVAYNSEVVYSYNRLPTSLWQYLMSNRDKNYVLIMPDGTARQFVLVMSNSLDNLSVWSGGGLLEEQISVWSKDANGSNYLIVAGDNESLTSLKTLKLVGIQTTWTVDQPVLFRVYERQ